MSLANYSDLTSAITNWLARSGDTDVTNRTPEWVTLCEQRIAYGGEMPTKTEPLRIAAMETKLGGTSPGYLQTVAGTETIALPADYLALRGRIYLDGTPRRPLRYMSPNEINEMWTGTQQAEPKFYSIIGTNIVLAPTPDAVYNLYGWYYAKLAGLVSNSTNWLMTNAPGVYLYGTLLEAAVYLKDVEAAQGYASQFTALINGLQSQDEVDRHSGAPLVMRNATGNP